MEYILLYYGVIITMAIITGILVIKDKLDGVSYVILLLLLILIMPYPKLKGDCSDVNQTIKTTRAK